MIVEYAGYADRYAGPGIVHEVRAWWNVNHDSEGAVKRAALNVLRTEGGVLGHAEVVGMDTNTYSTPQLNAMIRIRVLTSEQVARRKELRSRRYHTCDECGGKEPGQVVHMFDDTTGNPERALCYTCWRPLANTVRCKVLHWINRHGKIQLT